MAVLICAAVLACDSRVAERGPAAAEEPPEHDRSEMQRDSEPTCNSSECTERCVSLSKCSVPRKCFCSGGYCVIDFADIGCVDEARAPNVAGRIECEYGFEFPLDAALGCVIQHDPHGPEGAWSAFLVHVRLGKAARGDEIECPTPDWWASDPDLRTALYCPFNCGQTNSGVFRYMLGFRLAVMMTTRVAGPAL